MLMRMFGITFIFIMIYSSALCEVLKDSDIYNWHDRTYKLVYQAETWQKARDGCIASGGELAAPHSEEEFQHLQNIVRKMHYPSVVGTDYKLLAWLGINNLDNYQMWKNVDGENIEDTGFHTWSGENGKTFSDNLDVPHCAGLDAVNVGLRDFWCHRRQPYICEIKKASDSL